MPKIYKALLVCVALLIMFLQFYGIDRLVLNSDELHPARPLISDDWSLTQFPWPENAEREKFACWPIQFPPLFGLLTRASVEIFGVTHLALRIFPALFACAAVFASFYFFRLFLTTPWAVTAAIMLGTASDKLMIYAKSLKHYSADVFFSALLLYFGKRLLEKSATRDWLWFTLIAAIAPWLAFASVFVSCALYGMLFITHALIIRDKPSAFWSRWSASLTIMLVSFASLYFVNISKAMANQDFLSSWPYQVFEWSKSGEMGYMARYFLHLMLHIFLLPKYFFIDSTAIGIALNVCMLIWIAVQIKNKQWSVLMLALLPLIVMLAASISGKYPFFAGRLSLYLIPLWILAGVSGFQNFWQFLHKRNKTVAIFFLILGLMILIYPVVRNCDRVKNLKYGGGRRVDLMIQTLKTNAQNQDTAFLHWGAILPFYYYFTDHQPGYQNRYAIRPDGGTLSVIYGEEHTFHPEKNRFQFDRLCAVPGRLWVVFGHLYPSEDMSELELYLNSKRSLLHTWQFKGCKLALYRPLNAE